MNSNENRPTSIDNNTDRGLRQLRTMFEGFFSWRSGVRSVLFCTAVMLPLAFYLRTYDSATIKITIAQLGFITALTIWLTGSIREGRIEIPASILPFMLPAFMLLAWNAIRFEFSQYRIAAFNGFLLQEIFLGTFILVLLSFSIRDLRRAVVMILSGWVITVIYGLIQLSGFDPFVWKGAFGKLVFSTLGNPNFFGSYLLLCAPLAGALAFDDENPLWLRVTAALFSCLAAFLIACTGTVTEKIVFITAAAASMVLAGKYVTHGSRRIIIGLNSACIVVCLSASINSAGRNHFNTGFMLETCKGTISMIKTQLWAGSGPGSFWVRYPSFRRSRVILIEHRHNTETDHPENELLEQWSDGGIPGVLFWLWMSATLLYKGKKKLSDHSPDRTAVYGAGIYIAWAACLSAMLFSVSSRFPCPGWLIYLVAGLLGVFGAHQSAEPDTILALPLPFGRLRAVFFLLIPACAAFAVWSSILMFKSDIHHNMAIYWSKAGDWENALKEYDKEVPGSPSYIMSRYFKGNVFNDRSQPGDAERAIEQYGEVRRLAPDYVNVHFQEAAALQKLNRIPEAIEHMERQTQLDPVWDLAWEKLADLYTIAGNTKKSGYAKQKAEEAKISWTDASFKSGIGPKTIAHPENTHN